MNISLDKRKEGHEQKRLYWINTRIFENTTYIPTERYLVSLIQDTSFYFSGVPLPENLIEFGKQFQSSTKALVNYQIPFLGLNYKREQNGQLRVYHDEKNSLSLSESASGVQSILPLMIVVEHLKKNGTNFIVEEPELNLYPVAQKNLVHYLIESTNCVEELERGLILTTHSPYVLAVVNNLLYAYKVAQKDAETKAKVATIINEKCWLNPQELGAYFVDNAEVVSILDKGTELISENELDAVSEEIAGEFDSLIELVQ